MTQANVTPDQEWVDLLIANPSMREEHMEERFRELVALPEEERLPRIEAMVRAEYELPDAVLHEFTLSRMRAWLTLKRESLETAQALAGSYDAVFDRLPGGMAMRRATVVQGVARTELSLQEVDELFELIPSLVRSVPRASTEALTRDVPADRAGAASAMSSGGAAVATPPVRSWWRFWAR